METAYLIATMAAEIYVTQLESFAKLESKEKSCLLDEEKSLRTIVFRIELLFEIFGNFRR